MTYVLRGHRRPDASAMRWPKSWFDGICCSLPALAVLNLDND
jgi:hypothetical protein